MLTTILLWTYIFFLTFSYGTAAFSLLRRLLREPPESTLPVPILSLLGLTVTAGIASLLSLALPMGWGAHLIVLAGALLCSAFFFQEMSAALRAGLRKIHVWVWALALLGAAVILLNAVKPPSNPDTPLYHAQAIRWIEAYPAVPGLGNLDVRLGANSNWFVLNALFSLAFLGLGSLHLLPSYLFLVSFIFFLAGLQSLLEGKLGPGQVLRLGFIPLAFYVLIDEISSPGTDLPVILLYWLVLCVWLDSLENGPTSRPLQVIVFFLSLSVITYKVSGAPLVLAAGILFVGWLKRGGNRVAWTCLGLGALFLLPWLVRNFVLSGYWLFPVTQTGFLDPAIDWEIPAERVSLFSHRIQAWAITPGTLWVDIAGLSRWQRLAMWFTGLTLNQKGVFALALFSPLIFGAFSLAAPRRGRSAFPLGGWLVLLSGYINLLFWLFSAPNFRFGYGYVTGLALIAFSPFFARVLRFLESRRGYLIAALVLVLCLQQGILILEATTDGNRPPDILILPAPYRRAATDPCQVGDLVMYCARNGRQCGYEAFPCLPGVPDDHLEPRGATLGEGFRWRASTE